MSPTASSDELLIDAERALRSTLGRRVRRRFSLAPLTSFRIGGPAELFVEAESEDDLTAVARAVAQTGVPWFVLGKGSNVLVSDRGFGGIVVRLGKRYRWSERRGERLRAGAAMPLPALAGVALAHELAGLEFGIAIPASLGGAVRMNAGAHAHSMDEVLEEVELFSLPDVRSLAIPAVEAGLEYRRSTLPPGTIVTGATLRLRAADPESIRSEMADARAWRRATQPLAEPNCGSVFKNPPGEHAARLIVAAGGQGMSVGGASVSTKHANFVVVKPGTRATDVRALIERTQRLVEERFGTTLEPEVQFVGDFDIAAV